MQYNSTEVYKLVSQQQLALHSGVAEVASLFFLADAHYTTYLQTQETHGHVITARKIMTVINNHITDNNTISVTSRKPFRKIHFQAFLLRLTTVV